MTIINIGEANVDNLKKVLIGHSIKDVYFDRLILDNGYILTIEDTEENSAHYTGIFNYNVKIGNNIITNVMLDDSIQVGSKQAFRINVMAEEKKITDLSVIGDEGNGCYMQSINFMVSSPSSPHVHHWFWDK